MTARRELQEEAGLEPEEMDEFCAVIDRGGHRHLVSVFVTRIACGLDEIRLAEGQEIKFFELTELDKLRITPFVREVLEAYARKVAANGRG
jgi:ADP-ribose pyrophosphatase YjhB (NUDIX family)